METFFPDLLPKKEREVSPPTKRATMQYDSGFAMFFFSNLADLPWDSATFQCGFLVVRGLLWLALQDNFLQDCHISPPKNDTFSILVGYVSFLEGSALLGTSKIQVSW